MTPPAEVREALRALEKAADAHDYFARKSGLRMTTGDHAREAKRIRAAINDLTAQLTEANALRERDGKECVCRGNWRAIVKEYEPQIGKLFKDDDGTVWLFFGLVHADDDYYYGMCLVGSPGPGCIRLLSCCGSIEAFLDPIDAAIQARKQEGEVS